MSSNRKQELILKTYELLKTTSPTDITIRSVADSCGCTTPVIYKYFDNFDHLLTFSSIKFLENYLIDVQKLVTEESDPLDLLISMWQSFSDQAFMNDEVFEMLFWGKFKKNLGDIIFEYYQLFPKEFVQLDGLFTTVFFNNELKERNYIIVRRATAVGYFSNKDSRIFSDLTCDAFHGLLLEYKDIYRDPVQSKKGSDEFMEILFSLIDHYRIK